MSVKNQYYKSIQGWFNFENPYELIAEQLPSGSRIVEVGSWKGASTCYLASFIKENNLGIKIYAVDTWAGSDEQIHKDEIGNLGGPDGLYKQFLQNISNCGVEDIVTPYRLPSLEAASLFKDESLEFVYIDASHDFKNVFNDITAWYPKVRKGCVLGGHDYHQDGNEVIDAVHMSIASFHRIIVFPESRTWMIVKC